MKKIKHIFPKKLKKMTKKSTNTNGVKFVLVKAFVDTIYFCMPVWNAKKNRVYVLKVASKNTIKKYNYLGG